MSELVKRTLVAVIGIPVAILIIYLGGLYFTITVIVISSLGMWEYYKLQEHKFAVPNKVAGITANVILLLSFYLFYTNSHIVDGGILIICGIILFVIFVLAIEIWSNNPNSALNIAVTISGVFYISLSFLFLILIREFYHLKWFFASFTPESIVTERLSFFIKSMDDKWSAWFVLSLFVSLWLCDIAAYLVGMKFGKHKMFPRISPKKSWEGALGGFIAGTGGFLIAALITLPDFPVVHSLIIGILLSVSSQIGDLAESTLKRDAGIKDISKIFPGHGGVLDRFDGIMFAVPLVFIYLVITISTGLLKFQ